MTGSIPITITEEVFQLLRKGSNGKYEHNKYVTDNAHFTRFASKFDGKLYQ